MSAIELWEHVKELQELQLSRVFYRFSIFIASAVLIPLIGFLAYSTYTTLGEIQKGQARTELAVATLQTQVAILREKDRGYHDVDNANFDATKSQIRQLTVSIRDLSNLTQQLTFAVETINTKAEKTRKPRHATRR